MEEAFNYSPDFKELRKRIDKEADDIINNLMPKKIEELNEVIKVCYI